MTICCRPELPEDEPFLRRLVTDYVTAELGAASWPEPMRSHLVGIQYTARRQNARDRYPNAASSIVLLDEEPAGWLVAAATDDEIWLVDLIIGEAHRGQGVGSAVLRDLLADSDRAGKPVRLSVRVNNPALRLYERLGFRRVGGDELQHFMERLAVRA